MTYKQVINQALALYFDKKYDKAYDLITQNMDVANGNLAQLYNFRYSFLAVQGKTNDAFDLLKEAVVDKGFWYPTDLLEEDYDLRTVRLVYGFNDLLSLCKKREQEAYDQGQYTLRPLEPMVNNRQVADLFIALHGDQENDLISEADWSFMHSDTVQVAVMQSAESQFSGGYVWEDVQSASMALKEFNQTAGGDFNQVSLGGFSAGARVALWSVLEGSVTPKKLVLVAPWLPELDEWERAVSFEALRKTHLHLIVGDEDDDCLEGTQDLHKKLTDLRIDHEFTLVKGLGHDFPSRF